MYHHYNVLHPFRAIFLFPAIASIIHASHFPLQLSHFPFPHPPYPPHTDTHPHTGRHTTYREQRDNWEGRLLHHQTPEAQWCTSKRTVFFPACRTLSFFCLSLRKNHFYPHSSDSFLHLIHLPHPRLLHSFQPFCHYAFIIHHHYPRILHFTIPHITPRDLVDRLSHHLVTHRIRSYFIFQLILLFQPF